jgi:1-pyrroline-5-carboxylate dehydrogenase
MEVSMRGEYPMDYRIIPENAASAVAAPVNEPTLSYAPGNPERNEVKAVLTDLHSGEIEIPLIIGGKEVRTGQTESCVIPHDHGHVLATYHKAGPKEAQMAVEAALRAKKEWESLPWENRAAVFLRAAELLSGPWRSRINAAAMLGLSKTVFQAEIDAACELVDFFRFNAHNLAEIYAEQPSSTNDAWNRADWRPLEGFVYAVTPFNFLSVACNLPSAPALAGNTVVWKPASSAVYPSYYAMELLRDAGLPDGVINFVPGPGKAVSEAVLGSEWLAGINFVGSTDVFRSLWRTVGVNIDNYRTYPRLVGETGGKDFVVAHSSADEPALTTALARGAFEFQGQKCSAASRAYIPKSLWNKVRENLLGQMAEMAIGDVMDFVNFMGAVIDRQAFDRVKGYIDYARASSQAKVYGGECDDTKGYFIKPCLIVTDDPHFKTMEEEVFGPVLTAYVYDDKDFEGVLGICDTTSPYGLTGSIFARDRRAIVAASSALRNAAGNFYINDKPTGAVIGQQPFGGARASGTNDKAGSKMNMYRWMSPRIVKETLNPPVGFRYPFMDAE